MNRFEETKAVQPMTFADLYGYNTRRGAHWYAFREAIRTIGGHTMNRFEEAAIMRCETTPQPIDWQPGDWAIYKDSLIHLKELYIDGRSFVFCDEHCVRTVNMKYLTIPTRAQLAREIGKDKDGKPILAWAWEDRDPRCIPRIHVNGDHCNGRYVSRILLGALHIPIVMQSQIDRHYNGVFPPKE